MKRGVLCWVNLEPASPPEFGKTRAAVIVSNSEQNQILPTVVVIPLSTQAPEIWPLRLKISLPNGKSSFAVLPGLRQVNKSRIQNVIGSASKEALSAIEEALDCYLKD